MGPQGPAGPPPDMTAYYTKSQVDTLLTSLTSLIPLQPATSPLIAVNGTAINLSWNLVPQATSYNIYWGTGPGITKSSQKISNLLTNTYEHTGLTRGGVYFYAVSANYSTGEGSLSPEVFKQVPYAQVNIVREFEPNNTQATATAINIGGGSFRGQLSSRARSCTDTGDHDYYAFQSNGGVVQFAIVPNSNFTSGKIRASIVAQDGLSVLSSTEIGNGLLQTVLLSANTANGKYFLVINSVYDLAHCPSFISVSYDIFTDDYTITPEYVY